jgi:DnaJ domain
MNTLYDLLGALPHDNAEGLRAAFRRAVKGAHPDVRPDDPEAALKFREIVRANDILGDDEQRAAYDHLLELARLEQLSEARHAIAARVHKLASGVIALAGASVVTVGGYLLFMHMSVASVAPANDVATMRAPRQIVASSPTGSADTTGESASPVKRGTTVNPGETDLPDAAMPPAHAESAPPANAGPAPGLAAGEAGLLQARVISTDRDTHPNGPDQSLQLDPGLLPAYADRGIIFYRPREFDGAFADVTPAKRIGKASRPKSPPTMTRQARSDHAAIAPAVVPLPRPANGRAGSLAARKRCAGEAMLTTPHAPCPMALTGPTPGMPGA